MTGMTTDDYGSLRMTKDDWVTREDWDDYR